MEKNSKQQHFVLIHGACHGAWCWYKLVALLKAAGHNVTALDLAACGVNPQRVNEVQSLQDHVQPLVEFMSSLPQDEKIVLVGHSYGGISISQAMEMFPEKVLVAVYVTARALSHKSAPADDLVFKRQPAQDMSGNIKLMFDRGMDNPATSAIIKFDYMASHLYQNCEQEDVELAKLLLRPCSLLIEDWSLIECLLAEEKFGSVNCAYVICKADKSLKEDFQRWVIERSPNIKDVKEIEGADHMVMLSKPQELCACLLEIADSFNQSN